MILHIVLNDLSGVAVFDTQEAALKACKDENHRYAEVKLNKPMKDADWRWPVEEAEARAATLEHINELLDEIGLAEQRFNSQILKFAIKKKVPAHIL
jgi:hypothetical protein